MKTVRTVLDGMRHLLERDGASGPRDVELLGRFVHDRDESAFAAIVEKHGPMVGGVCRRVLGNACDADDALQGAFLVLARRAAQIRKPASLAAWLHGVAHRVALQMKCNMSKRRRQEQEMLRTAAGRNGAPALASAAPVDHAWRELQAALDEELERLPENNRQPLVLCFLEGLSQEEAAQQLGWPRGTVKRRLERGRDLLHRRLTRRGLTLGAGGIATLSAGMALASPIAPGLAKPLASASALFAAGKQVPTGLVSPAVLTLAQGVMRTMTIAKAKIVALSVFLLVAAATAGALGGTERRSALPAANAPAADALAQAPREPAVDDAKEAKKPENERTDLRKLEGKWRIIERHRDGKQTVAKDEKSFFYFTAARVKQTYDFHKEEGSFKIDPFAKPATIDIALDERDSPTGGVIRPKLPGIYQFDGDKLLLCIGLGNARPGEIDPPRERPVKFSGGKGENTELLVLKRDDPPKEKEPEKEKAPAPKGDSARLQGDWELVGMETLAGPAGNKAMPTTYVKFDGENYVFMQGEGTTLETYFKGAFTLNEKKSPKQIDIRYSDRKSKAGLPISNPTVEEGIYELKGDKLRICLGIPRESEAAQGLPRAGRPIEFTCAPGTGCYTLVLERRKKEK